MKNEKQQHIYKIDGEVVTEKQWYYTKYASNFIETGAKNFEIINTKSVELDPKQDMLYHLTDEELLSAMQKYARNETKKFIEVVKDRIVELSQKKNIIGILPTYTEIRIAEAQHILNILQS